MATLEPVAAGFIVIPSRDRERSLVAYYREQGAPTLPLDDALFELRATPEGRDVVLLPLRSYDAAKRVQKAFEQAAREHERAERARRKFEVL
jgi:hypothetical protein